MSSDTMLTPVLASPPQESLPATPDASPPRWSHEEWMTAFRDARKAMKDDLDEDVYAALRATEKRLPGCGSTLGVLVCPHCQSSQPASGDLATCSSSLCGVPGCPLCDADDRARRLVGLTTAFDQVSVQAAKALKRSSRDFKKESRRQQRAKKKSRRRHRYQPSREHQRRQEALGQALATMENNGWFACEILRPCNLARPARKVVAVLRRAATELSAVAAALWGNRVSASDDDRQFTAFGAWIELLADGQVALRCTFYGPTLSPADLDELTREHAPRGRVAWFHAVPPAEASAWAARLAGTPLGSCSREHPAESWLRGDRGPALDPKLAVLWALALAAVPRNRSDGLLRDHYVPTAENLSQSRSVEAPCAYCLAQDALVDTEVETDMYLERGRWYGHGALAFRVPPPRRKRREGIAPETDQSPEKA